jgi:hypothetical protein
MEHHIGSGGFSKKKQLTSEEIALRREETARKRKNMNEKKLEDEKVCQNFKGVPTLHTNMSTLTVHRLKQ